jgi:mono/diheme cytochrome c family protein
VRAVRWDPTTLCAVALTALVLNAVAPRAHSTPAAAAQALLAAPLGKGAAAELERQSCTSCHLGDRPGGFLFASYRAFQQGPAPRGDECARCHVNNALAAEAPRPAAWLPLGHDALARVRGFHAYVQNPALVLAVAAPSREGEPQRVARFTDCGLDRFLAAPLPRSAGGAQSMFPVEPARRRALLAALAPELAPCEPSPDPEQVARGRALYTDLGCASCHAASGAAPRLRLGLPLLARDYVRARVRHGSAGGSASPIYAREWAATEGALAARSPAQAAMPAHPELAEADLDALHGYLATDRSDVPAAEPVPPRASIDVPESIRVSLYREVQRRVFDTSCRHCHSDDAEAQALIEGVFGASAGAAPLALPTSRLPTPASSPALRAVLDPSPRCGESRLIARLRGRTHEWSGTSTAGAARGMPLTLPPLPESALRLVEVWTAAGCPSDAGDLCTPCA